MWILAAIVGGLMLAVVVVALLASREDEQVRPVVPTWSFPRPSELRDPGFPFAWQGYDPDHVDAWIEGVRRAQEELYAALGPSGVAELQATLERHRSTRRTPPVDPELQDTDAADEVVAAPTQALFTPRSRTSTVVSPRRGEGGHEDTPESGSGPAIVPKVRADRPEDDA